MVKRQYYNPREGPGQMNFCQITVLQVWFGYLFSGASPIMHHCIVLHHLG